MLLLDHRCGHLALLGLVWAALCLPNLGGPSLWDIDEGNNTEASREMDDSGNFVVPTFNYQLREDKPALLYWLQVGCFRALGVNERAARLPSALAALLTILATYELGRLLFGKGAGLLAGLILAVTAGLGAAAHFANPDALLLACTTWTLVIFWHDYARNGRGWLVLTGLTCALGVLAKGPIALMLPLAVTHLFLLWRREPGRLLDWRLLWTSLLFAAVAGPWYVWVGLETKGEWLKAFWQKHHLTRSLRPLEGHGGSPFYYLLVLVVGLAPWSVFLGPAGWHAARLLRRKSPEGVRPGVQFLLVWVGVYLVFFSVVRTKLPNYVLPLYPAAAVLLAAFLDAWRRGEAEVPGWVLKLSLSCLAGMGVVVVVGLLLAGGVLRGPWPPLRGRHLPGLAVWAPLGGLLLAGAAAGAWCAARDLRTGLIGVVACAGGLFYGALGAWGVEAVDSYKATRPLARALPADQLEREVRVGAFAWFQPSLVFYCRREVHCLGTEDEVRLFLHSPLPRYLFVPEKVWRAMREKGGLPCRVVARHSDLYSTSRIVLVTNERRMRPAHRER
jgi:4-amino-4-deoxy-L-arabinose transferase-like glycosyltransferase